MGNHRKEKRGSPVEDGEEQQSTGEQAMVSGIYEVANHVHAPDAGFFVRKGTVLPSCRVCGETISFRLTRKIVHVDEDPRLPINFDQPRNPVPAFRLL